MFKLFFESWHSGDIFKTGICFKLYLLETSEQNHKRTKIILGISISNSPFYEINLIAFNDTSVYITITKLGKPSNWKNTEEKNRLPGCIN